MPDDRPEPLVPPGVDLKGFSGFMLDVDRLLASELLALGTPEECWAALMLWCRAWKQQPPGSLPNNDRVLAAFSGAGLRWPKVKEMAMRGLILCKDDRLYHPVLTEQVMAAWEKRKAYRNDQERLKKWRGEKKSNAANNADETRHETAHETDKETSLKRVSTTVSSGVSEPDKKGQGQGQDSGSLRSPASPSAAQPLPPIDPPSMRETLWSDGVPLLRRLIGLSDSRTRSFLGRLLKSANDDCAKVYRLIREAESLTPADPSAWLTAACSEQRANNKPSRLAEALIGIGFLPDDDGGGGGATIDHDPNPDAWRRGL